MAPMQSTLLSLCFCPFLVHAVPTVGAEDTRACVRTDSSTLLEDSDGTSVFQKNVQRSPMVSGPAGKVGDAVTKGSKPPPNGKPWDRQILLESPESCAGTHLPFTGVYVINMDVSPEKWQSFLEHMRKVCGFHNVPISRHSGILATPELRASSWASRLIPGIDPKDGNKTGSLGSTLAHLSLWDRIAHSDSCADGDKYTLILEDDERVKKNFQPHVQALMDHLESLPSAKKPSAVLLNVFRPTGKLVQNVGPEQVPILESPKTHRRHDRLGGLRPNLWLSNYMVRCSAASTLVKYSGAYPNVSSYTGEFPNFDVQFVDVLTDIDVPLTMYVVGETGAISHHVFGDTFRTQLNKVDGVALKKALATKSG